MKVRHATGLVMLLTLVAGVSVWASGAQLYQYTEDSRFWWYIDDSPAFEMLVPALKFATKLDQFGVESLTLFPDEKGPIMTVGILKGSQSLVPTLRTNLVAGTKHLLTNVKVIADRNITTSTGLRSYFYAQVGDAADGKKAMFRAVFFQRGNDIVYLTYSLYESDYTGFNEEAWIRAVNTFRWL